MIIGIGTDMVSVSRIRASLDRHGDRFALRCFSDVERARVGQTSKGDPALEAAGYAKRWAAKEACAKALGIGIRDGIYLRDISVENDHFGKPSLTLTGGAARHLATLVPQGMTVQISLSMTDELPMAMAFVVISAISQKI